MNNQDTRNLSPGTIISVLSNKKFCVKTGNGIILIDDYEIENKGLIRTGEVLKSISYEKIYAEIEQRYGSININHSQKEITLKIIKEIYSE